MARIGYLAAVASALLATACTVGHPPPPGGGMSAPALSRGAATGPPPVRGAAYASGGCGSTPLLRAAAPSWASSANPPRLRYALGERGQVAGVPVRLPADGGKLPVHLGQDPLDCRFPPGWPAATGHRSSARRRGPCRVVNLASGFVARADLPVRHRRSLARLLAVRAWCMTTSAAGGSSTPASRP